MPFAKRGGQDAGERKRHSLGWTGHPRGAFVCPVYWISSVASSVSKKERVGENSVCLKALREDFVLCYLSNSQIKRRQLLTPEITKSSLKTDSYSIVCLMPIEFAVTKRRLLNADLA